MTLAKLDATMKTLAGVCAVLAGTSYAGFIPPVAAILLGFAAGLFAFLSSSPLFDPTLVGKTPWMSRACLTVAGLCTVAAGSSFFPGVQHLFNDGHAQKLATGLTMLGALCTFLSQSPILAGGTVGSGIAPSKLGILALLFAFVGLSGCAHVDAIAKDVDSCVKADGPAAVVDLEKAAPKIIEDILMCAPEGEAGIPACVEEGLASLVTALGPDGKRFELCVVNTIENDPAAAALAKARAKSVRVKLVREANGR